MAVCESAIQSALAPVSGLHGRVDDWPEVAVHCFRTGADGQISAQAFVADLSLLLFIPITDTISYFPIYLFFIVFISTENFYANLFLHSSWIKLCQNCCLLFQYYSFNLFYFNSLKFIWNYSNFHSSKILWKKYCKNCFFHLFYFWIFYFAIT